MKLGLKRILKLISLSLLIILVIFLIFNLISLTRKKPIPIFGYRYSLVVSDSMKQEIPKGSYILYKEQEKYELTDIIVYESKYDHRLIVHEIINITSNGFETKGTNNHVSDQKRTDAYQEDYIKGNQILGKVIGHSNLFGLGNILLNKTGNIILFVIAIIFILFIIQVHELIKHLKKRQEEKYKKELEKEVKKELEEIEKLEL
ncbi:Signal peptidase I [Alteracholeplasma palmae J233]|uniref:Signal peptidase I n=1 Tax=Alteracholeplasma palmae (strain ATCC 49389 / J233) TaxID=1318466 RepID=U4KPF6_ALTPJ|nr:signal peptidase I [Alteracholeplasma palmae]CCV64120.1 Signal peptidase I [Alteracholeplasma palmae J233]